MSNFSTWWSRQGTLACALQNAQHGAWLAASDLLARAAIVQNGRVYSLPVTCQEAEIEKSILLLSQLLRFAQ